MLTADITRKAKGYYPKSIDCQEAYIKGVFDGFHESLGTSEEFFTELAERLRKLWPTGEKDGKWPWKDSVPNLVERLKTMWDIRQLKNYTLDACISVAMRYVAQYEDNKKYMQVLKYYILKQKDIIQKNGTIKHVNESKFADMLEGKNEVDAALNEWEDLLNGNILSGEGGTLI